MAIATCLAAALPNSKKLLSGTYNREQISPTDSMIACRHHAMQIGGFPENQKVHKHCVAIALRQGIGAKSEFN
jgi:hypothetical protein